MSNMFAEPVVLQVPKSGLGLGSPNRLPAPAVPQPEKMLPLKVLPKGPPELDTEGTIPNVEVWLAAVLNEFPVLDEARVPGGLVAFEFERP